MDISFWGQYTGHILKQSLQNQYFALIRAFPLTLTHFLCIQSKQQSHSIASPIWLPLPVLVSHTLHGHIRCWHFLARTSVTDNHASAVKYRCIERRALVTVSFVIALLTWLGRLSTSAAVISSPAIALCTLTGDITQPSITVKQFRTKFHHKIKQEKRNTLQLLQKEKWYYNEM